MGGPRRTKKGRTPSGMTSTSFSCAALSHLESNKGPEIPSVGLSLCLSFPHVIIFSYIQLAWDCPQISSVTFYDPKRDDSRRADVRSSGRRFVSLVFSLVCLHDGVFNYTFLFNAKGLPGASFPRQNQFYTVTFEISKAHVVQKKNVRQ